jgi:hypothetical protein
MAPVTLYVSTQASPQVLLFALDVRRQGWSVLLRPLNALPAPRVARLASLRLEQAGLQQDVKTMRWLLLQYAEHYLLPDACHENGLRADLDATLSRLRAVEATLATLTASAS